MSNMNPAELVDMYTTGFRISLAITIIALAAAVFLFFKLDIKTVFMLVSGRQRKKTIQQLNEAQEKTDQIGFSMPNLEFGSTGSTGKTGNTGKTGRSGSLFRKNGKSGEISPPAQAGIDTMPLAESEASAGTGAVGLNTAQMKQLEIAARPQGSAANRIGFRLTERVLVVHTEELIEI